MVTISDVAEAAGVSVATVSRALNGAPTVNPVLARRAQDAATRLGYRPNGIARSLRRQATDVLALIISDVANPFWTVVTRGVEDVAQRSGFSVLLCNADEDPAKEATYLRVAEQQRVAGVVLSPHAAGSDVTSLRRAGIPCVVIDRPLVHDADDTADSVMVPSVEGARAATEHLLAVGWQRPCCITGPDDAATAEERLAGYRAAVAARGVADRSVRMPFRASGGARGAAQLLDEREPPDAFFVANSQMCLGVLEELGRRGLRVGRDVGLVMVDDPAWARLLDPPLTVVAQPAYEVGEQAAQLLIDRVRGTAPPAPRHVVMTTTLVVRGSSQRSRPEPADLVPPGSVDKT